MRINFSRISSAVIAAALQVTRYFDEFDELFVGHLAEDLHHSV